MQNLTLYIINIFTACILITLWRGKPQSQSFLYWGVALLTTPLLQELAEMLRSSQYDDFYLPIISFAFMATVLVAGLVFGTLNFKGVVLSRCTQGYLASLLFLVIGLVCALLPFEQVFFVLGGFSASVFMVVGVFAWSQDQISRMISLMFLMKAGTILFFALGKTMSAALSLWPYVEPLAAGAFLLIAIYLLMLTFQKVNDELRANLQFMGLAQSISKSAHSAENEKQLAHNVLANLMSGEFWQGGMLYSVDRDMGQLKKIGHEGAGIMIPDTIALSGTITEKVLQSKKPLVTSSAQLSAAISPNVRDIHGRQGESDSIIILIPLLDGSETEGVMILFHSIQRDVIAQELETLSSVGHIIGLAQAKIRDRKTLAVRASHDSLTGLGNRSRFHSFCESIIGRHPFSVMLFDLNDFKGINDVFGHAVGDQFLINISRRLVEKLPKGATAFRLGGDEFVVVFVSDRVGFDTKFEIEILSKLIKEPVLIDDFSLRSSAAIGVASSLTAGDSHELLRYADLAMYEAKKNGFSATFYKESLELVSTERMNFLVEIERAIQNGELELFYQPVMSLHSADFVKCEALLRWHHPSKGLMDAVDFMPWLESSPIIDALTLDVINMVARDITEFRSQGVEIVVSINLSVRNMIDDRLPSLMDEILANAGVRHEQLQLEISEAGLIRDLSTAQLVAEQFTERGYNLVIDNFGAGQSSLAYLSRFTVSEVKIDKGFVLEIQASNASLRLVQGMVALAHKLGVKVTAKGVENETTRDALAAMGCDFAQGYHYAQPMQKVDLTKWLTNQA